MASLEEEYAKYKFDMLEQGLEPMSMQQIYRTSYGRSTNVWWSTFTIGPRSKPVNPFQPKPQDQYYLTDRWQRMVVSWV